MSVINNNVQPLEFLKQFIAIPSVSSDASHKKDMQKAMEFLSKYLEHLGFEIQTYTVPGAHPLLIAKFFISKKAKTIAIYGHYDVQPEDPEEEWSFPPFELTEKDGLLFGRGTGDDKGHIVQHLLAAEKAIQEKTLQNNLIFIIEGEEEIGSKHFQELIEKAKNTIQEADMFIIADSGLHESGAPQFYYGLRGLVYFEIIAEVADRDLHSGIYGGSVLNPALVLSRLLSSMINEKGEILIPGFYDDIRSIPQQEKQDLVKVQGERPRNSDVLSFSDFDTEFPTLNSKIHPSFDINSFVSGSTGNGAKTIVPKSARAHFSFRLIEHQNPDNIEMLVQKFVEQHLPKNIRYSLKAHGKNMPFFTDLHNPVVKKIADILAVHYKKEVQFNRTGGSIPAAETLQRMFNKPAIVTGFLRDFRIHAPNEYIEKDKFLEGIEAAKALFSSVI